MNGSFVAGAGPGTGPSGRLQATGFNNGDRVNFVYSGGNAGSSYSLTDASGTVRYGPTSASGSYTFSAAYSGTVTVDYNNTGLLNFSWSCAPSDVPIIATTSLSPASLGSTYSETIAATGGAEPYTFSLSAGAVPSGLNLASSGLLSGTPTAAGIYNFTVTVTDGNNNNAAQSYTLNVSAPPGAPTIGTATAGDAQASISFTAPANNGGASITGYTVTSSPGGLTATGSASPLTIAGLTNGTAYTFTVTATNSAGTGAASSASNSVTPRGNQTITFSNPGSQNFGTSPTLIASASSSLPVTFSSSTTSVCTITSGGALTFVSAGTCSINADQAGNGTWMAASQVTQSFTVNAVTPTAPTIGTATAGDAQASISFTAPANNGGASITGYTVTSNPGGLTGSGSSSPLTVTGLTNGTAYTFTVTATNSAGTGAASSASNSVTPRGSQAITFNNPGTQNFGTSPTLIASASSGLSVTFSSSTTSVCTITSGGTLTFVSAGTCAINADQAGNGTWMAASQVTQSFTVNAVTPTAPTIGTATAGDAQASISFTAPANNGGASITGYTVTSSPGGLTATGSASPLTVNGLANGTAYTFTVTATNSAGTGSASPASNSVTPKGSQTITFSNPGTQNFGTSPTLSASASSGLPVTFSSNTTAVCTITTSGEIRPISPGTCTINASQAGDGAWLPAPQVSQSFTIAVPGGAVAFATISPLSDATGGRSYTQTFNVTGGASPYTFSMVGGSLPPGLTLSGSGGLSGVPVSAGTYTFLMRVTDAAQQTAQESYQLVVSAPAITIDPATLPAGEAGSAYLATLVASGGTAPYTYNLNGTLPAGVTYDAATATISGTPTQSGMFNVTITANDSLSFDASTNYTIVIVSPTIGLSPSALPNGIAGMAYSQALTASGGIAPYEYALSGALPAGMTFDETSGSLFGTPTESGTFNVIFTATDSTAGAAGSISAGYTLVVAAPNIAIAPATLPAGTVGTAYNETVSASGGIAPYSYTQLGTVPPGLAFDPSSGHLSGTPTTAGSFSFSITATDGTAGTPGTASANYTIVIGEAVPVTSDDTAQTVGGQAVIIPVAANDTGVITSVSVSSPPAHGNTSVSGTSITYMPAESFSGSDVFEYTATGPGGTSLPSRVVVTVDPSPIPQPQSVSAAAGRPVVVDLAKDAAGGPFIRATVVLVEPSAAGSWSLDEERLTFASRPDFDGPVTVRFTLTNAYATSAQASLTITVEARPNPALDPEVMGILQAQTEATRRFATSQVTNFQSRLESLHQEDGSQPIEEGLSFANGVVLNFVSTCTMEEQAVTDADCGRRPTQPAGGPFMTSLDDPVSASVSGQRSRLTIWTGGSITVGERDQGEGLEFQTTGLSIGLDYRINGDLTVGVGAGYGHDATDIGDNGSRSRGKAYTAAVYGTYHPGDIFFIDGIAGYQWLSFDTRRYVTADDSYVDGERNGNQLLVSISAGAKLQFDRLRITPYGRLDVAHGKLESYTENGSTIFALRYGEQEVDTTTGNIGVTLAYKQPVSFGEISPRLRLEYQHDFRNDSYVTLNYADVFSGPSYQAFVDGLGNDRFQLGVGLDIETTSNLSMGLEYRGLFDGAGAADHSFVVKAAKRF